LVHADELPRGSFSIGTDAYIDDRQNASTASALMSTGQPIQVTPVAGEPPV
jgi:hypothetical protein